MQFYLQKRFNIFRQRLTRGACDNDTFRKHDTFSLQVAMQSTAELDKSAMHLPIDRRLATEKKQV